MSGPKKLWPFFSFYGGKWRAAPRYPQPGCETIIEPFAGAAGYATRHHTHRIVLVERDAILAELWRYLISVPSAEITALPLLAHDQTVDDFDLSPPQKSLIGFWLNKGTSAPCRSPSAWMRNGIRPKSFWGPEIRSRIASQVDAIRHWTIIEGDYFEAPDIAATWFIDPPYEQAGRLYRHGSHCLDFTAVASWCRGRQGQIIVCENEGAEWLPFAPFMRIKSTQGSRGKGQSAEALYHVEGSDLA